MRQTIMFSRLLAVSLVSAFPLFADDSSLKTASRSTGVSDTSAVTDDPRFPAEVEYWKNEKDKCALGIVEAESLRARLLRPTKTHATGAAAVAEMISQFQAATKPNSKRTPALRRDVQSFNVSGKRLLRQIRGDHSIDADAFDCFNGQWFGLWDQLRVSHDWRPSRKFLSPKRIALNHAPIKSLQYAWISNGFGWNYVSAQDANPERNYILGMVYYFSHPDYQNIIEQKPHVGFADGPTRLIWITEFEVYLEEAFPESSTGEPDCYTITGLRHDLLGDSPSISPEAVQATYTRNPAQRPAFQKIVWLLDEDMIVN